MKHRTDRRSTLLLAAALLPALPACKGDGQSFSEAVSEVYKPCEADPIKFAAASKGMQLVFEPCGSNNFLHFAWAPDGLTLYYQTQQGPWILRDTREHLPIGIGIPRAGAAWVNNDILAFPDGDGRKIGIYNTKSNILNLVELDQVEPEQLAHGRELDEVLYLAAETPGGLKWVYRLRADTGESERAFSWQDAPAESFTYRASEDVACLRSLGDSEVVCTQGETGKELHRLKDRKRATLSPDGRYLVSEGDGQAVPIFGQGKVAAPQDIPAHLPREVVPPQLWILDRASGEELLWEGVNGTEVGWYDATPYFLSMLSWGFDAKQFNRNVPLVDLRHFLKGQGWKVPLAMDGQPAVEVLDESLPPEKADELVQPPVPEGEGR